jgi:hypothetical protein
LNSLFGMDIKDLIEYCNVSSDVSSDQKGLYITLNEMGHQMGGSKIEGYWYDNWCNALIDIYENMSIGGDDTHQNKIYRNINTCPKRDVPIERLPTQPTPLQPRYEGIINDCSITEMETVQKLNILFASRMDVIFWTKVLPIMIHDNSSDVTFDFDGTEIISTKKTDSEVKIGDRGCNKSIDSNPILVFNYEEDELFYIEFPPKGDGIRVGVMSYSAIWNFINATNIDVGSFTRC